MEDIEIRLLEFPMCVRERSGMYIGGLDDASVLFREIIDNSFDESYAFKGCDKLVIDQNFGGYHLVCDNGRGLPILMSPDKPEETQAAVSLSTLHSGSKFGGSDVARGGMNGVGSSVTNALSERYILLSKITEANYDKSIPPVRSLWESSGPRSRKDLFYVLIFERGYKVFEGASKLSDIDKNLFPSGGIELPRGFSTLVLFKPDSTIFDKVTSKVPIKNIQYFLLIQEKFYKRKVGVLVNGKFAHETFKPYQFELIRTIVPADTSKNKSVSVYVTFEVDPSLGNKVEEGSVSGLVTESGVHINYLETCYEQALKSEFKIAHKYLQNGLKICVIILAGNVVFDSQTKTRLKSISKVKVSDFGEVVKDFIKIFRQNREYWEDHVMKLNMYAESMKSFSAVDKAKKMISSATGSSMYRTKMDLVEGFADATGRDRMDCEILIVEGKSPASSLISGRKNTLQHAVLPLRGKVLNTSEKSIDEALNNKELFTLLKLIGLGINEHSVVSECSTVEEAWKMVQKHARYGKIIIATDEDPDGQSIRNLLIYFICKFARFLIDLGMVYIVESPLYIQDGKFFYVSDPRQAGSKFPVGLLQNKPYRYIKGLGGLNSSDVYDSFYNPATRRLIQITPENMEYAMSLVEDIELRKKLLFESGILSNPFGFNDL